MPLDWGPFIDLVRRHSRFLLTTHVRPDGDGLGSMLALGEVLERLGKQAHLVIASSFNTISRCRHSGWRLRRIL